MDNKPGKKSLKITDLQSAKKVIKKGFDWCIRLSAVSIVAAIVVYYAGTKNFLSALGFEDFSFFDGILILLIGWGIFISSRIVTGVGFAFYILERTYLWVHWQSIGSILVFIIMVVVFITSMKTIGIYNKLRKSFLIKRNIIILNILALLYSIIVAITITCFTYYFFQFSVTELIYGFVPDSSRISLSELLLLSYFTPALICLIAVTYVSALTQNLPFTKNRDMVRYGISEESVLTVKLKDDYSFPAIYHTFLPVIVLFLVPFILLFISTYIYF